MPDGREDPSLWNIEDVALEALPWKAMLAWDLETAPVGAGCSVCGNGVVGCMAPVKLVQGAMLTWDRSTVPADTEGVNGERGIAGREAGPVGPDA